MAYMVMYHGYFSVPVNKGLQAMVDFCSIEVLQNRTLKDIKNFQNSGDDRIVFTTLTGDVLTMYHRQDCCESVEIESISGDLEDLIGTPIIVAEERSSSDCPPDVGDREYPPESETWTFYTFRTIKGTVDIRWYGQSNGYYSESVTTEWEPAPNDKQ